jgi:hypothetical protein
MSIKHAATILTLALCTSGASVVAAAQTPMPAGQRPGGMGGMAMGPKIAPGTILDPAKSMDDSVTALETLWMNAAKAMPAEKYSFAPSAAIFVPSQAVKYDGVRTFAQLCTHTIQANYRYFGFVGGIKPEVDVAAIGKLTSKDDILKAMAETFAFAHKAVANVTPANAFESVRGMQTRATTFGGAIAHAEDEYGQAVEYLRMNAIIPPASQTKEM